MIYSDEEFCKRLRGLTRKEAGDPIIQTKDDLIKYNQRKKPNKGQVAMYGHVTYEGGVDFLGLLGNEVIYGGVTSATGKDRELINEVLANLAD